MKQSLQGPLFILLGALCFSTTGTSQALAPEGASPAVIGAMRMLLGGAALLVWCVLRGKFPVAASGHWPLRHVLPAALSLFCYQVLFFSGVLKVGVATGTVVTIGFSPLAVAVLSFFFFGEKPGKLWYPATTLALAGLVLLNFSALVGGAGAIDPMTMLLPLGAGFSYACYFTFSKPLVSKNAPESVMMVLCFLSGACLLPLALCQPLAWLASPTGVALALHLGLVTTALAFSLTLAGIKRTPVAVASTLSLAEPLGAACLGIFVLQEPVSTTGLAGMLLMLGSVGILLLPELFPGQKKA